MRLLTSCTVATLLAALTAGCVAEAPSSAAHHLSGSSPYVALFKQAANEADLPADFLAAWSHMETRFQPVQPDHHDDDEAGHLRAFGIMGLTDAQMERAAPLTGDSPDMMRTDALANIRAAAFLIRQAADSFGRLEGNLTAGSGPLAWAETMSLARQISDDGMRYEYVRLVAEAVGQGLTGTDETGRTITLEGRGEIHVPARQVIQSALDPQDPYSARYVASPNYNSRNGTTIDRIIIHTTQGSYAGAVSWFQNPDSNVSAHYVIRSSDGQITQMVRLENRGWHVGNYNSRSIGIEHEGFVADPGRWYTDVMYQKSAQLTRWLCDRYNIPKDRSHIIGHVEAPGATHTDPGNGWNWTKYMNLVRGSTSGGGTGTDRRLVGVAYNQNEGSSARIAGATIKLIRNGAQVASTTSSSTGFWAFNVSSGTYTVKATAQGFQEATREGSASSAGDNWASIGLTPTPPPTTTGTYRGVVYSGAAAGENPVGGAVVRLSSGQTYTTGSNGTFIFNLPPGEITATASKSGYQSASVTRTVTAGQTVWGSIRIVQEEAAPVVVPPGAPNPISPVDNAEVDGVGLSLTFSRVTDPQNAAVTYDVEVFAAGSTTDAFLTLGAEQSATSPVIVAIPVDLPEGAYSWRVRARSSNGTSPWSSGALFSVRAPEVVDPGPGDSNSSSSSSSGGGGEGSSSSMAPEEGSSSSSSTGGTDSSTDTVIPEEPGNGGPAPQDPPAEEEAGGPASVGGCASAHTPTGGSLPALGGILLLFGMISTRRRR